MAQTLTTNNENIDDNDYPYECYWSPDRGYVSYVILSLGVIIIMTGIIVLICTLL